jgi:hypothetical protein
MTSRRSAAALAASIALLVAVTGCESGASRPTLEPDALVGAKDVAGGTQTANGINTNGINTNGINTNGINTNGINTNGINTNGINTNGINTNGINTNGINTNGINTNGINTNGINTNGINTNGINTNGLAPGAGTSGLATGGLAEATFASAEFQAWFAASPSYADMVMRYVVACAAPGGTTKTFTYEGTTYTWTGSLGVAPAWSAGEAIGAAEQELVSACLAAHTNGLGQHVTLSVRGYHANGQPLETTAEEVQGWQFREACFMGNLFDGSGVGVALQPDSLDPLVSTPRGCAAEFGVPGSCPPMVQVGMCADLCTPGPDGSTYASCTVNGRAYRALQVHLQASDVWRCGDGVCQSLTENATTCSADCAP